MTPEDVRWEKNTPLRDMMERHNLLVDEIAETQDRLTQVAGSLQETAEAIQARLHELNDIILGVNYKTDRLQQELGDKIEDVLHSIRRNHPDI